MYYLYAIGEPEWFDGEYLNCYVGVTKDLKKRWKMHSKSNFTVGKYIRERKWTYDKNFTVIACSKDCEWCFEQEERFRPLPYIGLNEASGGRGGYTAYTEERAEKIAKFHRGKKKSKKHVENLKKSKKDAHKKNKNPNAKKWVLTNPEGVVYNIHGDLSETCKKLHLLESCLRYNKGNFVKEPNLNGYGGYRAKSKESLIMRMNTTGWKLEEVQKHSGGV